MKRIGVMIERQRAYGRRLCDGIIRFAQAHDEWGLEMLDWDDVSHPSTLAKCDGFIARIIDERTAHALSRTQHPVVDVFANRLRNNFSSADQDATAIGQLAVKHFTEHLFTNFAFFGHEGQRYSDLRRDAFLTALSKLNLICNVYPTPRTSMTHFNHEVMKVERYPSKEEYKTIRSWIQKLGKPVAVFCSNDLRAYQLISVCRDNDIHVPEAVSVLGVDNDSIICNFIQPPISSIDPNADGIGFAAAEELARLMNDNKAATRHLVIPPAQLFERKSSRAFAVEPAWISDALVYIRRNLQTGVSAAEVCTHVGRSHTVVNAAFKRTLNATVQKTIVEIRLQEALRLIKSETFPIARIATLSGFSSVEYFTNSFTGRFGKPPSFFRTSHGIE